MSLEIDVGDPDLGLKVGLLLDVNLPPRSNILETLDPMSVHEYLLVCSRRSLPTQPISARAGYSDVYVCVVTHGVYSHLLEAQPLKATSIEERDADQVAEISVRPNS